jgi:hypothetical protein
MAVLLQMNTSTAASSAEKNMATLCGGSEENHAEGGGLRSLFDQYANRIHRSCWGFG